MCETTTSPKTSPVEPFYPQDTSPRKTFQQIYDEAHAAGMAAGEAACPRPMVVGQAKDIFSNKIDYTKPTYVVPDGPCGFAWVKICDGRSRFARWLAARDPHKRAQIWVSEFNQSYTRKAAYAQVFANVLRKYGIRCIDGSRLD